MQFPFNGVSDAAPSDNTQPNTDGPMKAGTGLREIWAAVYRARFWVIGIFAVCIVFAVVIALLSVRLYEATASVEVRQEAQKVLGTEQDGEAQSNTADINRFLDTQLDIIRSRTVAERVAESEGLYNGDGFLEAMGVDPLDGVVPEGLNPRDAHIAHVLDTLRDAMAVRFTGSTRILEISFTSPDPRLSARLANAFAQAYIRSNLARKSDSSVYALDFLRDQLAEAQARLAQSEQEVLNYARPTRIVDAGNAAGSAASSDTQPQSLITAQLVQLNQAYSTAVAERIEAEQKWRQIANLAPLSTPDVLNNNAVQGLLGTRADVQANYEQQLATRREDYPTVVADAAELRELDRQINSIARNIRSGIRNEYQIAQARQDQLAQEIDSLKSSTLAEQGQGIQLSILRREADTNRQQYESLLRRYNELNAESGIQTNNLSIVDLANVPASPSWPKLPLNIALALTIAMVLSALFVLLREQLFSSVRTPEEVGTVTRLPILGVVPASEDPEADLADPKSFQSDAFNSVRTSLSLLTSTGIPSLMMVTSTQQGEGKSTTCKAIALSMVRLGKRVVLVDIDLRRPNLHRLFDLPNSNGFSNLSTGQIDLDQAIRKTSIDNLDLIVAGDIPPNPTELMDNPRLPALLDELRARYDVVMIDSAPVLGLADAVILASRIGTVVYVIESGANSPRAIQSSLSRLSASGGTVAGAVLVKFDPGRFGYGYGTEYGYNYDYGARKD